MAPLQVHQTVCLVERVAENAAIAGAVLQGVLAGVVDGGARVEQARAQRRDRRRQFERRARRVVAGDRPVVQRRVRFGLIQVGELLGRDSAHKARRIERRRGRERTHRSVTRIKHNRRPRGRDEVLGLVAVVGSLRSAHRACERGLGGGLDSEVERQADVVARNGVAMEQSAHDAVGAVDLETRLARHSAQPLLVEQLDAALADLVARAVVLALARVELVLVDLADVAEEVRGERSVRIGAFGNALRLDAREVFGVLADVDDRFLTRLVHDRHGGERREARILYSLVDRLGSGAEQRG